MFWARPDKRRCLCQTGRRLNVADWAAGKTSAVWLAALLISFVRSCSQLLPEVHSPMGARGERYGTMGSPPSKSQLKYVRAARTRSLTATWPSAFVDITSLALSMRLASQTAKFGGVKVSWGFAWMSVGTRTVLTSKPHGACSDLSSSTQPPTPCRFGSSMTSRLGSFGAKSTLSRESNRVKRAVQLAALLRTAAKYSRVSWLWKRWYSSSPSASKGASAPQFATRTTRWRIRAATANAGGAPAEPPATAKEPIFRKSTIARTSLAWSTTRVVGPRRVECPYPGGHR